MFPDSLETIIVIQYTIPWSFTKRYCRLQSGTVRETFRFLNQNPYRCMDLRVQAMGIKGYIGFVRPREYIEYIQQHKSNKVAKKIFRLVTINT